MAFKPTKPLTGDELCSVRPLWPRPIVAAVIVGDRSPAQGSPGLYRQIFRLSYHSPDEVGPRMDEETEAALDAEPVILENAHAADDNYKYGRKRRWPHMSEEAESALGANMDAEANGKLTDRELKRQSREAR